MALNCAAAVETVATSVQIQWNYDTQPYVPYTVLKQCNALWTKCIRRNMRSTCQWSCVLQFTWRRAVCCGLHRPMSQVIPCLGLRFNNFVTLLWYQRMPWVPSRALKRGCSELPWRNPLETNNATHPRVRRSQASTKDFIRIHMIHSRLWRP